MTNSVSPTSFYQNSSLQVVYTNVPNTFTVSPQTLSTFTNAGPVLVFYANSLAPAVGDKVGVLQFFGNNSLGTQKQYGEVSVEIFQATANAEYSCIRGQVMVGGSLSDTLVGAETFLLGYANPSQNNFEYVFRGPNTKIMYMYLESRYTGQQGPTYNTWFNKTATAINDINGTLAFDGNNSAGVYQTYSRIDSVVTSPTAGSASADLVFSTTTGAVTTRRARLDSLGQLTLSNGGLANTFGALLEVVGDPTVFVHADYLAVGANIGGAALFFLKTRATSPTVQTIVASGDQVGSFNFKGSDGAAFQYAASIQVLVDGTPAAGSMPGRIAFYTTPSGSTTTAERMRITNSGGVAIGTTVDPGNTNLSVAGTINGVTLNNTAFTVANPTITSGSGTLTSVSSTLWYKVIGKVRLFQMTITITTNGTGATSLISTNMPWTANHDTAFVGSCPQVGKGVSGVMAAGTTTLTLFDDAGGYPTGGANGQTVVISGVAEV